MRPCDRATVRSLVLGAVRDEVQHVTDGRQNG
jgi:hypothetical protein